MLKNMAGEPLRWRDFITHTGHAQDMQAWMTVWLVIVTDNTLHLLINYFAIKYL